MKSKQTVMLTPGDVTARPVTDKVGNVLVQAGVDLTPTIIKVLERRGVDEVFVRNPDLPPEEAPELPANNADTSEVRQALIRQLGERLDETFKFVGNDPLMRTLRNAAESYLTEKIKQGAE